MWTVEVCLLMNKNAVSLVCDSSGLYWKWLNRTFWQRGKPRSRGSEAGSRTTASSVRTKASINGEPGLTKWATWHPTEKKSGQAGWQETHLDDKFYCRGRITEMHKGGTDFTPITLPSFVVAKKTLTLNLKRHPLWKSRVALLKLAAEMERHLKRKRKKKAFARDLLYFHQSKSFEQHEQVKIKSDMSELCKEKEASWFGTRSHSGATHSEMDLLSFRGGCLDRSLWPDASMWLSGAIKWQPKAPK